MKNLFTSLLIVICVIAGAATSMAQEKVGYINSANLLAEMSAVKSADSKLESMQKQLMKRGQDMVAKLQKKEADALAKMERNELTDADRERIAGELQKEGLQIQQFEQKMYADLEKKRQDLLKPILDKVNKGIQDVAKENGYTYIVDASTGVLLYARPEDDITKLVKAKLGM